MEEDDAAVLLNSKELGLIGPKEFPFYNKERWALRQKVKDNGPILRQPCKNLAQPGFHICESRSIL
jgi:hypothetical protein